MMSGRTIRKALCVVVVCVLAVVRLSAPAGAEASGVTAATRTVGPALASGLSSALAAVPANSVSARSAAEVTATAAGDLTVSMTVTNLDHSLLDSQYANFINDSRSLSDAIERSMGEVLAMLPAGTPAGDAARSTMVWPSCVCTLSIDSVSANGQTTDTLTITVPAGDVHTELAGWLINLIAGTVATLVALIAAATCAAMFGPGAPLAPTVCGPVFAFFVGLTWSLVGQVLGGKPFLSADTWTAALVSGLVSAAGAAAVGAVIGWAGSHLKHVLTELGTAAGNTLKALGSWIGNTTAWQAVSGFFGRMASAVKDRLSSLLMSRPCMQLCGFSAGIAPNSLRILPFGDSITEGFMSSDHSGYRCDLQENLATTGFNYQFVGSLSNGSRCAQVDNEGHGGWKIAQLAAIERCTITGFQPNVVLLDIGTNDIRLGGALGPAVTSTEILVGDILADAPGVTVLVSGLIPTPDPTVAANMNSFNQQLSAWIDGQQRAGKRVMWVDQGAVNTQHDLADGLHPNDTGYLKMASAWTMGIDTALARNWIQQPNPRGTGCGTPGSSPTPGAPAAPAWTPWGEVASGVDGISPPIWQPTGEIATGVSAPGNEIQFADVFGSGRADYLRVQPDSSVLAWRNAGVKPNGVPTWVAMGKIATGVGAPGSQIQFADVTGDGRADYLNVQPDSSVLMWQNGGLGSNGLPTWIPWGKIATGVGAPGSQIQFADVTGDGHADYLNVQPNSSVIGYQNPGFSNNGNGASWVPLGVIASGVGAPGSQIRFADVFGSGRADYLNVQADSSVIAYYNPGLSDVHDGIGWLPMGKIATGVYAPGNQIQFADVTGDGRADYLDVQDDSSVLAWNNEPGPGGQIQFAPVFGTDRDDYLDVLPDGSVNAWYNSGTSGTRVIWVGPVMIATGVGAPGSQIRFADITGDGRADYLWVHPDSSVTMWENPGIGAVNPDGVHWLSPRALASGVGVPGDQIRFADLNGDGRADYLWVHGDSSMTAWFNPGMSTIDPATGLGWVSWGVIATGVGAPGRQIQFADLTGSGRADYLNVQPDSSVLMWRNAG